jgi:tetrahydromethanopterin S-methyltransferase subunit F
MSGVPPPDGDGARPDDDTALLARASATRLEAQEVRERAATMRTRARGDLSRLHEGVEALRVRVAAADARSDHLERALASNRRIGIAIGILMAVRQLTEEEAFRVLQQASSRRNTKLRDIAEEVIYTGRA